MDHNDELRKRIEESIKLNEKKRRQVRKNIYDIIYNSSSLLPKNDFSTELSKLRKKHRRTNIIITIIIFLFLLFFTYTFIIPYYQLHQEEKELKKELKIELYED